jgi:hypothetical protein
MGAWGRGAALVILAASLTGCAGQAHDAAGHAGTSAGMPSQPDVSTSD